MIDQLLQRFRTFDQSECERQWNLTADTTKVCVLLDVGTKPTGTSIYEVSASFVLQRFQDNSLIWWISYTNALKSIPMSEALVER